MSKDKQIGEPPSKAAPSKSLLYCDGACSGNPGPGGWGSILLTDQGIVQELGGFEPQTTNNRMELTAALKGLTAIAQHLNQEKRSHRLPVDLLTDSVYVIRGMTEWIHGWSRRGWLTSQGEPVANRDLWEDLLDAVRQHHLLVQWLYVPGHKGIPGNERADAIAVDFSKKVSPNLFYGPLAHYPIDLQSFSSNGLPNRSSKSNTSPRATAYYISYVNQKLEKHTDWKDCEARVKGRAGAKFKKISSPAEEEEFLKKWGVTF